MDIVFWYEYFGLSTYPLAEIIGSFLNNLLEQWSDNYADLQLGRFWSNESLKCIWICSELILSDRQDSKIVWAKLFQTLIAPSNLRVYIL